MTAFSSSPWASELNQRTRVSRGELDPLFGDFLGAMGASSLAAGRQPRGVATDTCAENITIRDPMTGRRGPAEPHRARHWRAQIHGARVAVEAPTDASRSPAGRCRGGRRSLVSIAAALAQQNHRVRHARDDRNGHGERDAD